MTPQEEQLLNSLVDRINQTQLQEKDTDAEALLNKGLAANPDAIYILAQTVLVQNVALEQAKAQVTQLQQQTMQLQQQLQQARQQPAHATSFLGNLLGRHDTPPAPPPQPTYLPPQQQGYAPPPPPPPGFDPQYAQPGYPQPGYPQPGYPQPQYIPAGQPSFMRGAMQTAAGVAAGALAFEGVEAVLHGIGGMGHPGMGMGMGGFGMSPGLMGTGLMGTGMMGTGMMGTGMMGTGMMGTGMMGGGLIGGQRPVEETIVNNNYYDQPGGGAERGEQHFHESSNDPGNQFAANGDRLGGDQFTSNQFANQDSVPHFTEQSDRGGAQFSDASYTTPALDSADQYADTQDPVLDEQIPDEQIQDEQIPDEQIQDDPLQSDDTSSIYDDGGMSSDDSGSYDDGSGGGGF